MVNSRVAKHFIINLKKRALMSFVTMSRYYQVLKKVIYNKLRISSTSIKSRIFKVSLKSTTLSWKSCNQSVWSKIILLLRKISKVLQFSCQELSTNIHHYKNTIDIMYECLYRKSPKSTSLKKTLLGLNKLQTKQIKNWLISCKITI